MWKIYSEKSSQELQFILDEKCHSALLEIWKFQYVHECTYKMRNTISCYIYFFANTLDNEKNGGGES